MAATGPQILISPVKKSKTAPDPNLSIANYLAQDFDEDGRVSPVVWGYGDPVFRDAALDGKIQHAGSAPNLQTSLDAAAALGAPYVLIYNTEPKSGGVMGHAELYVNGHLRWKDDLQMSTKHGGDEEVDDVAASLAHSWVILLNTGAFKQLTARPKNSTPVPSPGQAPPVVQAPPQAPAAAIESVADFQSEVRALEERGQNSQALIRARDAIDAHPMSPELRLVLVRLLEVQGQLTEAAHQATRAAELMPENHELRLSAIRDLLASGQQQEAKQELNEILARQPNDATTLLLQGQTYLAIGRPDEALSAIDHLLDISPSPQALYWRAVTRALLGGADGVLQDAEIYKKAPMADGVAGGEYSFAMDVLDTATKNGFTQTLRLFSLASTDAQGAQFRAQLDAAIRTTEARANFLSAFPAPEYGKKSNSQRLLAQKLLDECLADLLDFAKSGSEDSVTDARINLGEAMKQSKAANLAFAVEKSGAIHGGSSNTHG